MGFSLPALFPAGLSNFGLCGPSYAPEEEISSEVGGIILNAFGGDRLFTGVSGLRFVLFSIAPSNSYGAQNLANSISAHRAASEGKRSPGVPPD
jgi:hypothetical protein